MYDKLGALDRAVEDFTRAIESEPTNAVYSHNRGYCYRNMGDYERYAGALVAHMHGHERDDCCWEEYRKSRLMSCCPRGTIRYLAPVGMIVIVV